MSWKNHINAVAGWVLGGTLLFAGALKTLDPAAFATQISAEGLAILLPAMVIAVIAIGIEVGLGLALILGHRHRSLLVITSALVAFFLFLTGRSYWKWTRGELTDDAACGCFGSLVERTPAEAFWQDVMLLLPTIIILWLFLRFPPRGRWFGLAPVLACLSMVFSALAPGLPLDNLATGLRPGKQLTELCAGGDAPGERACVDLVVPELNQGDHWVVMAELDNPALLEAISELNQRFNGGKSIWLITPDEAEAIQGFTWTAGPSFPVREVPLSLLRRFYRKLPRSFHIVDGTVTETQSGIFVGE